MELWHCGEPDEERHCILAVSHSKLLVPRNERSHDRRSLQTCTKNETELRIYFGRNGMWSWKRSTLLIVAIG